MTRAASMLTASHVVAAIAVRLITVLAMPLRKFPRRQDEAGDRQSDAGRRGCDHALRAAKPRGEQDDNDIEGRGGHFIFGHRVDDEDGYTQQQRHQRQRGRPQKARRTCGAVRPGVVKSHDFHRM
jgi:hypothetical protein